MSLTCHQPPAAPSAVSARARGRGSGDGVDIIDTIDIVDTLNIVDIIDICAPVAGRGRGRAGAARWAPRSPWRPPTPGWPSAAGSGPTQGRSWGTVLAGE